MSVNLFSNTLSATYSQQVIKRAVKNHVENLASTKENISGTKNASDVFVARRDKQSNLSVANTYMPPSLTNKVVTDVVTDTITASVKLPETSEKVSSTENLYLNREFGLATMGVELYSPSSNLDCSINSFLSFLYGSDMSKFSYDKNLEQQKTGTTKVIDHHGFTFEELPAERKDYTEEYLEYLQTSGKDLYDESRMNDARKMLINREISSHVLIHGRGAYSIGIVATGNNNSSEYAEATNMEKILIEKLAENNISLDSKEGFVIKIDSEGIFTLGDHNIKDSSKVDEIKKMIETDEGLQKELTDICSSLPISDKWSFDDDGNVTSQNADILTISPFGLTTNADTFRDGNSAISDFIGLTFSEFRDRLNARS
jgi:hypothetical protein